MKVHVIGRFPPPLDGQTLATQRLAELLAPRHDVLPFSTSVPEAAGVQVEVAFRWDRLRHYARLLPALRRALRRAPAAPVLWGAVSPAPLGHLRDVLLTLPAFAGEQPVYAVLHRGLFEQLFRHPLTAPTARLVARRMTGFVFLNAPLAEACAPFISAEKRHVIPNTIDEALACSDDEVAAKLARADDGAGRPLRLLFLSNLIALKGYRDVLHAAALARERGLDLRVDFAGRWGDAAERETFDRIVADRGLHDVVRAHGPVRDRSRVKALHLAADVFVLPSYHPTESQGIAVIEAMNAGAAVIVTDHGGLPSTVDAGRNALLVPPRSPAAIADAVATLADPATRRPMAAHARRWFLDRYSPDAVRARWEALLQRHIPAGHPT